MQRFFCISEHILYKQRIVSKISAYRRNRPREAPWSSHLDEHTEVHSDEHDEIVSASSTSPPERRAVRPGAPRETARRQCLDLLDRLRLLVHYSSETPRRIERRAGLRLGYLSQILQGRLELKLEHALALIHALDFEPDEVLEGLFSEPRLRADDPGAKDCRRRRRRDGTQALALELAKTYGLGLDSLDEFLLRLERYEEALRERDLLISEIESPSSAGPRSSASLCDG